MPLMWRENTLNMEWCLACHRAPEQHVRPRERLFDMDWTPEASGLGADDRERLAREYHVQGRTSCSACHR